MKRSPKLRIIVLAILAITIIASPLLAYNYLKIHPETNEPVGWEPGTTIEYYLDPGPLGKFSNEQVHTLLKEAFRVWEDVENAEVPHFEFAGYLPEDVTKDNYSNYVSSLYCYSSNLEACKSESQKKLQTVVIFDDDNYILDHELCKITPCSAVGGGRVFDSTGGGLFDPIPLTPIKYRQGIIVIGRRATSYNTSNILGTFVHEIGHLLGLAHPLLNQQFMTYDAEYDENNLLFIATMEASNMNSHMSGEDITLNPDDIAGISVLYPREDFGSQTATVEGEVLKADGTPLTHANVIVRNISDPFCLAYSGMTGRSCDFTTSICESSNLDDGTFRISGILPGTYTIEVEGFADDTYANTVAPGVIDPPVITGNAEFWNENDLADEEPLLFSSINLQGGTIRDNIVITLDGSINTADQSIMIPYSHFIQPTTTLCVKDTMDYDALIGINDSSDNSTQNNSPSDTDSNNTSNNGQTDSTHSSLSTYGGCSLLPSSF